MHSICPYTVRCYDSDLDPKVVKNKYSVLDNIRGHDLYEILRAYIEQYEENYIDFPARKTIMRFRNAEYSPTLRIIHGWLDVGTYGVRTDIVNRDTGEVDFKKTQQNAEIIPHYFCFLLPTGCDEGIALLASFQGRGIKTLFGESFFAHFTQRTHLRLQMNPLSYDKAMKEWQESNTIEIRGKQFVGYSDLADALSGLGHEETDIVFKPPKMGTLGKFSTFKNKSSVEYKAVEALSGMCSQVRAVVKLGARKRVFRIGPDRNNSVCQIELDESVTLSGGMPELQSIHSWGKELLREFVRTVYPGQQVDL